MTGHATEPKEPIPIAEYLFRRLVELGAQSIHGVPGDYNLEALDYVTKCGARWVGNVNELNAGYAADGYARVKGIGAIVTTFGVGELSAVNALAGAYSEHVPVVHIVGYPSTTSMRNGMLLHHTLGNGDFTVFRRLSSEISCATRRIDNVNEAAESIDSVLRECWIKSRPVYVALPCDMVHKKIEGARLRTKLNLALKPNEAEKEAYIVENILRHLLAAKHPVILVDACASRHRATSQTHDLIKASGLPVFVTPMGKGAVDETLPTYGGVYAGSGSNVGVRERVESADLVLTIGSLKSDFNTSGFTMQVGQLNTIDLHSDSVKIKYSDYSDIHMHGVLEKVTSILSTRSLNIVPGPQPENKLPPEEAGAADGGSNAITHAWLWPKLGAWLRENDIIITETGTANFGIWDTRFPRGVTAISQVLWGSIGYATAACQGAVLAAKEMGHRRTILFTGDGSFQLTAQEVSTMVRYGLSPIIFVICNKGYTIERYIHGWNDAYNDIQEWKYREILTVFGCAEDRQRTYAVHTREELNNLFADPVFSAADDGRISFVELHMPRDDAPRTLKITAEAAAKRNAV